jgi:hypothetical protein
MFVCKEILSRGLFTVLLMIMSFSAAVKCQDVRAIWIWGQTTAVIEDSASRLEFFNFCENPPGTGNINSIPGSPRSVNRVYFYAPNYVTPDSAKRVKLRAFLKEAHEKGIEIEYLDGASNWATTNQSTGRQRLKYVLEFNSEGADASEKFDGIQYDVEPYLLTGWSEENTRFEIWNSYIAFITEMQSMVDSANDGTYFGVAIPRWFESKPGISQLQNLINIVDYIAIMNYVDDRSRLISDAKTEIDYASTIPGKKVIVGVETKDVEPETVCFHEEGWGNMESMLYEMDKYYRGCSGYAGIAVHALNYYLVLPQYGLDGIDVAPPSIVDVTFVTEDTVQYFDFYAVDITGTGLDETKSLEGAMIFTSAGNDISGAWKTIEENHLLFYPDEKVDNEGLYKYMIQLFDSVGNQTIVIDSVSFGLTSVDAHQPIVPLNCELYRNYPNPFNPTTTFSFKISETARVTLKVHDILGREVAMVVNEELQPGSYNFRFDASNLSSGIYFYTLTSGRFSITQKMVLIK